MKNGIARSIEITTLSTALLFAGCQGREHTPGSTTFPTQPSGMTAHNHPTASPPTETVTTSHKQTRCPVTGEPLDSMGGPIPVDVEGETVYVCCKGCVKKVKKNPQKYLALVHTQMDG